MAELRPGGDSVELMIPEPSVLPDAPLTLS